MYDTGPIRPCIDLHTAPGRERRTLIVLGLNAFGHDAAAVLLIDGEAVFAASEERYDRTRHSAAFPRGAIAAALARAGLTPRDVDVVAFPWTRGMARWQKVWHVLKGLPATIAFLRERPQQRLPGRAAYLGAMRSLDRTIRAAGLSAPLVRVPHHEAHATSAALALPDGRGAVLTADGMGEWTTAASWQVEDYVPRRLRRAVYPHSPGKAYAAVTQWLGFWPESDEGKTMGLAPYGDPASEAAAFTRGLLAPDAESLLRLPLRSFGFPRGTARLWGRAFSEALGRARKADTPLRAVDRNAARGIQEAVEVFGLAAARQVLAETGADHLGLAGGLFLNCALNGHLARSCDATVLPFPVAGDAGAAWGAAAAVHRRRTNSAPAPLRTLQLGHEIGPSDAEAVLPVGRPMGPGLARAIAERIAAGRLVGLARGRAEFGPRALGARSILGSPTTTARRDRLNDHKGREDWRPLAPIVAAGDDRLFEGLGASPWMILTFAATAAGRRDLAGAVHVDGSARVQTVEPHELLGQVIAHLPASDHPPALLNTSFNRPGEPIVNTAKEALVAGRAMRLDTLVLDDRLVDLNPEFPAARLNDAE